MKKGWLIWILIIGGLVGVFFAYNYQGGGNQASLTEIFPDDAAAPKDVEYEFVDGAQVEQTAQTIITENPQAQAAATTAAATATQAKAAATTAATTTQAKATTTAAATTAAATTATAPKVELSKIPFTIQVASFKEKAKADKILAEAQAKNFPAYLTSKALDTGTWYRIYVGEFKTKSEADAYLTQVKAVYQGSFVIAPK